MPEITTLDPSCLETVQSSEISLPTSQVLSESLENTQKVIKESELNSNVLVNKEKISEDQIEKDIEELAYNDNDTITLPKPLLDLKRKQDFNLWKESILKSGPQKVIPATEQTLIEDYFTKSITKKRKLIQKV